MTKSWFTFAKWSVIGVFGLFSFYILLSTLISRSLTHSLDQFVTLQPWMTLLILTFGAQLGIYKLIHSKKEIVGASGTINGTAMVLCCTHHVSELLPFLGITGISFLLSSYQKDFLVLGTIANLFSIFYFTNFLVSENLKRFRYSLFGILVVITLFGILFIALDVYTKTFDNISSEVSSLTPKTKQVGVVEVEVTPKKITYGKQSVFSLKLNNHSVNLAYDYTKIAVLTDSNGNIYKPINWSGNSSGHHISGDLTFSNLESGARSLELDLNEINNQKAVFEWKL